MSTIKDVSYFCWVGFVFGLVLHFCCIGSIREHCVETGNNGKILINCLWCCPIGFIAVSVAFGAFLEGFVWASIADA
jgi:hypothetical protein